MADSQTPIYDNQIDSSKTWIDALVDETLKLKPDSKSDDVQRNTLKENFAQLPPREVKTRYKAIIDENIKKAAAQNNGPTPISYPELFIATRIQDILNTEDDIRVLEDSKARSIKERSKRQTELEGFKDEKINTEYSLLKQKIFEAGMKKRNKEKDGNSIFSFFR